MKSAYIHIPFCKQKCLYCDFNSFAGKENLIEEYIQALKQEIINSNVNLEELYTIYIGGGTPSFISEKYIEEILSLLPKACETTIEINPGTITKEKLLKYKAIGINRISIGLQTTDERILKTIGRIHSLSEFEEAYKMVRETGFENVNVDLMFGLPNQTLEIFKSSIEYLIDLKPEHISSYSLILHNDIFENLPTDEEERKMYHYLVEKLKNAGYTHYEISNFALKSFESKHNLAYWEQKEYYGFGAGASSYLSGKRYTNISDIQKYIKNILEDKDVKILEEIETPESKLREYIILGLRKVEGINILETNEKFDIDILKKFGNEIEKLQKLELLEVEDNIKLTKKGLDLANIVWEEFI